MSGRARPFSKSCCLENNCLELVEYRRRLVCLEVLLVSDRFCDDQSNIGQARQLPLDRASSGIGEINKLSQKRNSDPTDRKVA